MPSHVLIVDDDRDIREMVRALLEEEGFSVIEARDGQEGLTLLQASATPLLVLLDGLMPKLTGEEVLRAVAAEPALAARHSFILMTALRDAEVRGVNQHVRLRMIAKPFDINELIAVVRQITDMLG